MKRIVVFFILGLLTVYASAQYKDYVVFQDTDVYMFNPRPDNLRKQSGIGSSMELGTLVQQYVPQGDITVYGIALTIGSWSGADSVIFQHPKYTAVLMQRPVGGHDSISYGQTYRKLRYVDSVQIDSNLLFGTNIKYTKFRYEYDYPHPYYSTVPCYEFYFAKPYVMTDTFYVGRKFIYLDGDPLPPASEYCGIGQVSPATPPTFWCTVWPFNSPDTAKFIKDPYATTAYRYWGFSFPIIGFHCKPLDEVEHPLLLSDVTADGATVRWYSVEEGAEYNVRLASTDGTVDTIIGTDDSSYTFHGLPTNKCYEVQVRKVCEYALTNYDTVVYSPWTTTHTAFVLGDTTGIGGSSDTTGTGGGGSDTTGTGGGGSDTISAGIMMAGANLVTLSPNPVHGEVQVTSSFGLRGIEVYNAAGLKVHELKASGYAATLDISALPEGSYLVRVATPSGTVTKKLVVQRR